MNRQQLVHELQTYHTSYVEEKTFAAQFLSLLVHDDCFQRTHLPGHITGSSWIVNPAKTAVVMVHHAKLNRWLQPGGHADGCENVLSVALKEAQEETGILELTVLRENIFDLDIHRIPERKDFPAHDHYDIRYLFQAHQNAPLVVSDESHDVKWVSLVDLDSYTTERAVLRLREKLLPA